MVLEVLAPEPERATAAAEANDLSLVVRATVRGVRVLLTGDLGAEAEARLRTSGIDLRADVLKVPHHGSADADPGFLAASGARTALISVGADNTYGHPARSLLEIAGAGRHARAPDRPAGGRRRRGIRGGVGRGRPRPGASADDGSTDESRRRPPSAVRPDPNGGSSWCARSSCTNSCPSTASRRSRGTGCSTSTTTSSTTSARSSPRRATCCWAVAPTTTGPATGRPRRWSPSPGSSTPRPKHVFTSSPLPVAWSGAVAVQERAEDHVARLKAQPGGDIGVHGSITLAQSLLAAGLVDELRLVVVPTVAHSGRRLFQEGPARPAPGPALRAPLGHRHASSRTTPPGAAEAGTGRLRRRAGAGPGLSLLRGTMQTCQPPSPCPRSRACGW